MLHLTSDLAYWIQERYNIKLRREAGLPKPWSSDKVFQSVRFCNVHREDDKVTVWIRQNWNRPKHPAWMFVLARMLNLIDTLGSIADHSDVVDDPDGQDFSGLKEGLKAIRSEGTKVFTSAYTISTCGKSMDKIDYVVDWVCQRVKDLPNDENPLTCEHMQKRLTRVDGLGSFLAAQVVADMKNTVGHPLSHAPDFWSFSAPGPGSLRGLSWYFYGSSKGVTESRYTESLVNCRSEVDPLIPGHIPRISDQDFQNCLCEFSKYMKVFKDPNAHVRNHYPGHA